ncbi:MAG: outer membrane protein assembly factor BamA [Alphaproteobacteria bacterium]
MPAGRWRGRVLAAVLVAAAPLSVPVAAQAQSNLIAQGSGTIEEIRVAGTQRIDPTTVVSYLEVKPGDGFDSSRIDASLKSLFATGLFADVTLRREGRTLIVQVVENPIINRIAFEGNSRLEADTLTQEVSLRPRVVYTRTKVQSDVQRILELYRRSGRFAATVEPKVIQLPENRVDLVFEIDEGPATGIRKISFIGNHEFSDGSLRDVVKTIESAWWNIFNSNDTYDPDRLAFDRELLRRHYLKEGYADFRVASAVAELTRDREDFIVTFTVDEGQRYRFGKLDVSTSMKEVDPEILRGLIVSSPGEWYNASEVEKTIESISDVLGSRGFAFVEVRPRVERDRANQTIAVTYDIRQGPRVYIERINVTGNLRTLDSVIRREFDVVEGDAFNSSRIRKARERLNNLGYFSRVDVQNAPGSAPDRATVNVEVEEKSTGELSIGAGYSSTAGALADISLRERNLLGRGQDLQVGLTLAQRQQQVDLSFTEPYFLDKKLTAGFDLYHRLSDFQRQSSFDERRTGGALRAGYQMAPQTRHNVRYTLVEEEIRDVDVFASPYVKAQEGETLTSMVGNEISYDDLDNRFNPTDGTFAKAGVDLAGFGGTIRFVRNIVSGGYYVPVFGTSLVAAVSGEAGWMTGIGQDTRISNRFFVGGDSLRGFKTAGVGPRDAATEDSLGGTRFATGTTELIFPLGLPEEFNINGSVFSDFGTLTESDESGPNIVDDPSLRASLGAGISWRSPFGPVRVDYALPIAREDYDQTEALRFSFGTRF